MSSLIEYKAQSITWAQDNDASAVDLYKRLTIETLVQRLQDDNTIS